MENTVVQAATNAGVGNRAGVSAASCGLSKRKKGKSEMIQGFSFRLLVVSEEMRSM